MDAFDFAMAAWCGAPGTGEAPACPITSPPTASSPQLSPLSTAKNRHKKGNVKETGPKRSSGENLAVKSLLLGMRKHASNLGAHP